MHSIRFLQQELGLTAGQFNSIKAEGRVKIWVEIAAPAFWHLRALSGLIDEKSPKLPGWRRSNKITPGAVRMMAAGVWVEEARSQTPRKLAGVPAGCGSEAKGNIQSQLKCCSMGHLGDWLLDLMLFLPRCRWSSNMN